MSFAATFRREPSAVLDRIEVLVEVGDYTLDGALPLALEGVALAAVFDERDVFTGRLECLDRRF